MADRFSLPTEFYDIVSKDLLRQPLPQFLYAQMLRAAGAAEVEKITGMGVTPERSVVGQGASYDTLEQDRLQIASPLMTDIFQVRYDAKANPSAVMKFNRPVYTNTTHTMASREIQSGQSISTTPVTPDSDEQVFLTVKRFAGPYDSSNNRVAPFPIDELDASFGVHKLVDIVGQRLRYDHIKTRDTWITKLLDTMSAVYGGALTADNDATAKGMANFSVAMVYRLQRLMDEANLPTFTDGNRLLVLTPMQIQQLQNDPIFRLEAHDHPQYSAIFPQFIKQVGKFNIFKSNTLTVNSNGSGIKIHYGHAIAPGVLGYGMCDVPKVRAASDDNYGLNPKVIWEEKLALGVLDQRFGYVVKTTESNV